MSWSSTQRVAEAVLLVAIRYGAPIRVETVDNDHAIGVSRECIDQIVAEMDAAGPSVNNQSMDNIRDSIEPREIRRGKHGVR
ncbi:hypothetical protein C8F01DRAFT_1249107 [Mycena amicta]|nr:hypothetical protein C8F01DRAFT_1249107 [Mycena amicta]